MNADLFVTVGTVFLWYLAIGISVAAAYILTTRRLADRPTHELCARCAKDQESHKLLNNIPGEIAGRVSVALAGVLSLLWPLIAVALAYHLLHDCAQPEESPQ